MGRRKSKLMPSLDIETSGDSKPSPIEAPAPIRVSKRASTSQFSRSKRMAEQMPDLEKEGPAPKKDRRSMKKTDYASSPVAEPEKNVEEKNNDSQLDSSVLNKTLEEMKRIIGGDINIIKTPPVKIKEEPKDVVVVKQEKDDEEVEVEKKVLSARKRSKKPPAPKVVAPVEESPDTSVGGRTSKRQKKEKKIFDPSYVTQPSKKKVKHSHPEPRSETVKTPVKRQSDIKKSSPQKSAPVSPTAAQKRAATTIPTTKPAASTSTNSRRSAVSNSTVVTMIKQQFAQFCYICLGSKGNLDQSCPRCGSHVHNKCLETQQYITSVKILGKDWLCTNCLQCSVCGQNSTTDQKNDVEIFVCITCKKFYHARCHRPGLVDKPIMKATWKCHTCAEKCRAMRHTSKMRLTELATTNGTGNGNISSPDLGEFNGFNEEELKKGTTTTGVVVKLVNPARYRIIGPPPPPKDIALKLPARIDEIHKWTVDDVYEYFHRFFPEYAKLFRDQEIDGMVLLLMRRSDVIKGFEQIKLGPAMNIYRHIVMMQTKCNDPTLTWY